MVLRNLLFATVAVCALLNSCSAQNATYPTAYYTSLMTTDVLVNADLFDPEPKIMSAKYAFEGIKGVPNGTIESYARAAGGTWNTVPSECSNSTNVGLFTTVADPNTVAQCWGYPINDYADAMPVVFSWPVLPSTVQPTDFNLTLNTGEVVHPEVAALCPNLEYNERQTVVIFGKMGNRIDPSDPGAQYVTKVEIVDDGTPLQLVGPGGKLHSAVGMTYNSSCCIPYGKNAKGPGLVAAKLSVFSDAGEGPVSLSPGVLPNACSDMYGPTDYRLRLYTSGGFSPDGVSAMFPTDYAKYFRVHVDLGNGTLMLNDTGVEYPVPRAGSLTIMGLADLGKNQSSYDGCYQSDQDNYIDICINGTKAAAEKITFVEMPVGNATADPAGQYQPLYNPGGPGNNPTPGVNYTAPSPYQLQSVMQALDDPMVVSYGTVPAPAPSGGMGPGMAPAQAPSSSPPPSGAPSPITWSSMVLATLVVLVSAMCMA